MLAGLSRECILAARRWRNSRVKWNWPCTSYFLCSPAPIRPLEGLTLSTLKLLWAFPLCVEDFGTRLLNPKEENQDYTPVGESWGTRSLWYTSISLAKSFCQNNPATSCWSSPPTQPSLSFRRTWILGENTVQAFVQKDSDVPTNTTDQCVAWSVGCALPPKHLD